MGTFLDGCDCEFFLVFRMLGVFLLNSPLNFADELAKYFVVYL